MIMNILGNPHKMRFRAAEMFRFFPVAVFALPFLGVADHRDGGLFGGFRVVFVEYLEIEAFFVVGYRPDPLPAVVVVVVGGVPQVVVKGEPETEPGGAVVGDSFFELGSGQFDPFSIGA